MINITTTTTLPWPNTIHGVVGNRYDGCGLLSLVLFCLYKFQGQSMGEDL